MCFGSFIDLGVFQMNVTSSKRIVYRNDARMILIPAGKFDMGTHLNVVDKSDNQPVHTVYVSSFYIDKYAVTNAQYCKFVLATGYKEPKGAIYENDEWKYGFEPWKYSRFNAPNQPVVCVTWYDALEYAKWAGKRLPTEAEWEKAARGGLENTSYPWGDSIDSSKANYKTNDIQKTTPVGKYPPNGNGLYDMAGNVYEWCLDEYEKGFYAKSPNSDPIAGSKLSNVIKEFKSIKTDRVLRGGSWRSSWHYLHVANRAHKAPTYSSYYAGFRCVTNNLSQTREHHIQSIANTIKDYKVGKIAPIGEHVEKWINQFNPEDQLIVLAEIDNLLRRFYYSKERTKKSIREDFLSNFEPDTLKKFNFLRIQEDGESQAELLKIIDEILQEHYNFTIHECGGSNVFVYIDDGIFTGNRLHHDVVPWIEKDAPHGCKLSIYHIASHKRGLEYASGRINIVAQKKQIDVRYRRTLVIDNQMENSSAIEFLWPKELVNYDEEVSKYCNQLKEECVEKGWEPRLFRNPQIPNQETLFSSSEARDCVEKSFLKVGARIVMSACNPAQSLRPLGFEKLPSLGLGSLFVTYRNVPNNCPLALWWGESERFGPNHPLGLWYPLFPRKIREDSIIDFWGEVPF